MDTTTHATSESQTAETRIRRRLPCSLKLEGEEHRALILNLSRGGLFVRTNVSARPGDQVEVELSLDEAPLPIELKADVVWRRVANSNVSHVNDGGIGLRLDSSPEAYSRFVRGFVDELVDGFVDGFVDERGGGDAAAEPELERPRFEVLLKLHGAPRSRCLQVSAEDEEEATSQALAEAGAGWEVLEVRAKSAPAADSGANSAPSVETPSDT